MGILKTEQVIIMVQRALNLVDERLVDHGKRVAMLVNAMLDTEGFSDWEIRKNVSILALLHDIGAYRTEEIDQLVMFETENVWEHSVYGYLFLREFTPLEEYARVLLCHHARFDRFPEECRDIMHFAQMVQVADRVDVLWGSIAEPSPKRIQELLLKKAGTYFDPAVVELFFRANEEHGLLERLNQDIKIENILDINGITEEEARHYLELLVHVIDFRSHHTVTHTVNTIQISSQLAVRMGLKEEAVKQVYYGALLHDLGKIGTPLSILEKPGRLTPEEMAVMQQHVVMTGTIIKGCVEDTVAEIALRHHEKLDGSGYPLGLTAGQLSVQERIVAIADIISALCGTRSYKNAFPKEKVLSILNELCIKGQIDTDIVHRAEQEFDAVMEEADRAGKPVMEKYEWIRKEYLRLLKRYDDLG